MTIKLNGLVRILNDHGPVYRRKRNEKFVVLTMEGEETGMDGQSGGFREFDTMAEAVAYLRGLRDAMEALDLKIEAVLYEHWHMGHDESTKEKE